MLKIELFLRLLKANFHMIIKFIRYLFILAILIQSDLVFIPYSMNEILYSFVFFATLYESVAKNTKIV